MRILILARVDLSDLRNEGVRLKLFGQRDAFIQLGHSCDLILHHGKQYYHYRESLNIWASAVPAFLFKWLWYDPIIDYLREYDTFDLILLRYGLSTPSFIRFIQYAQGQGSQLVIDMPTFPYRQEWSGIMGGLLMLIDRYYARYLSAYISLVTVPGQFHSIWGIPALMVHNGVNCNHFTYSKRPPLESEMHFISIAKWQKWHGLDRFLKGLTLSSHHDIKYYLHLVGDGPELKSIRKMVQSLGLKDRVFFYPAAKSECYDHLFAQSHMAIGTLGLHRKGVLHDSSLKHREYCARGIPFILAAEDLDFPLDIKFVKKIEASESSVNLDEIIDFYLELNKEPSFERRLRQYAEEKLSWVRRMQDLLTALKNN